jgi:hypothetical protein
MPNHSLPSHLLDWLWIGLSTGPNGAVKAQFCWKRGTGMAYLSG